MDVVQAIKRSCNTWFFQAAKACGGPELATMGSRFGFGDKTGICLEEMEVAGRMPNPEYYAKAKKGPMIGGNLANVSIGQGQQHYQRNRRSESHGTSSGKFSKTVPPASSFASATCSPHSTFCTCSRIRSTSVLPATMLCAIPRFPAFEPTVFNSRFSS